MCAGRWFCGCNFAAAAKKLATRLRQSPLCVLGHIAAEGDHGETKFVRSEPGALAKLLAIPFFFLAGVAMAAARISSERAGRQDSATICGRTHVRFTVSLPSQSVRKVLNGSEFCQSCVAHCIFRLD
jgi:hypothetical protein